MVSGTGGSTQERKHEKYMETIRQALIAAEQAALRQEALDGAELERARCQNDLDRAEANLTHYLEKLSLSEDKKKKHGNETPRHQSSPGISPAGPSNGKGKNRSRELPQTPSHTPSCSTPSRASAANNNDNIGTPLPPPGSTIRTPSKQSGKFEAYIVYVGPNNEHRLFYQWKGIGGGEQWIEGVHMPYYKGFSSAQRAVTWYRECEESGVFDALQITPEQKGRKLFYIVTYGVVPGVYDAKYAVVRDGLQWRGGTVTVLEGTRAEAEQMFRSYQAQGHVRRRERFLGSV